MSLLPVQPLLRFSGRNPRLNLPRSVSRKRGESGFVSAFSKVYMETIGHHGFGGKEFPLPGYGVADFLWMSWTEPLNPDQGTALSVEDLTRSLGKQRVTAFEMKLSDWQKGLSQAYRYRYFAHQSILVLPAGAARMAVQHLALFKDSRVGLWTFDQERSTIRKWHTPRACSPYSSEAHRKAIETILEALKLG
jgi:hypothetical protein